MSHPPKQPCVFFDRDGIANRDPHPERYVTHPDKFHIYDAFIEALRVTTEKGYAAVIVTNQKGVGSGVMTQATLDAIHEKLFVRVRAAGLQIHDLYAATTTDDAHPHRKPNPGMILDAAAKHGFDLSRSWMVGDNESDVTCGHRAGVRTIRVCAAEKESKADFRIASVEELPSLLRKLL